MVIDGMQGLIIRPGDTLLIAPTDRLSDADLDMLREQFDQVKVVVVEGATAFAVYRPDAPPAVTDKT